ncbi:MAG: peptidylprolyl isomerase [Acidiferrobacterales bacterium]
MLRKLTVGLAALLLTVAATGASAFTLPGPAHDPIVQMVTSLGTIELELFPDKAPVTVKNFLGYVNSGFYNGTIFHRVIPGFMIQGGGFEPGMRQKPTRAPILNEAGNGLRNTVGTIAMARTGDPNSATAQFFINTADNAFLDHRDDSVQGWGYAVFGKVIKGMKIVRKIEAVPTGTRGPFANVPLRDVVIRKMVVAKYR